MNLLNRTAAIATALLIFSTAAIADGQLDGAVKARKSLMRLYAFNIGQLVAMAKGEADYDAKVAASAAGNLNAIAHLDQSAMWPQGSDNAAMGDKTRALPELWSTFPKVLEAQKALNGATGAMAEAAGKDLASLQGALGAVGKSCGGCHKPFRAEKK